MFLISNSLYGLLKGEEVEKASTILKRTKIEAILQNLSKLCWKYNIQYEIIIKTNNVLQLKFTGIQEIIIFKFHKTEMVSKAEIDFFMSDMDENKACKGFYITTGDFEINNKSFCSNIIYNYDLILESGFTFIKNNLGLSGMAERDFVINKINLLKYLPK